MHLPSEIVRSIELSIVSQVNSVLVMLPPKHPTEQRRNIRFNRLVFLPREFSDVRQTPLA